MIRQRAFVSVLGVAAAGLLVASAAGQTSELKPRPLLVGIVDLGVVFTKYARTAEMMQDVEKEKAQLAEKVKEQEKLVEKARRELDEAAPGSSAREEKALELKMATKTLDNLRVESEQVVRQRFERSTLRVIDEIDRATHEYARDNHFDLILKTTTKGWGEGSLSERIYRAQISTVVAYDPKLDVTDSVVEYLNKPENLKKGAY